MDATTLGDAIASQTDRGVPAARALFRTLLLAETDPPEHSLGGEAVLLARLDRLLAIGALDEAKAMVERAGPDTPELFRRWFDVALLLNEAEEPCATLAERASLSPTLPARVFCLARGGDWNAAEITLTLGQDTGAISETQELLLARFLDPGIFENDPPPPIMSPFTPLEFLMREAVALPRPPGPLPVAFLHADLGEYTPVRMRIEAAERLYLAGGIGREVLFAAYRAGEPAASGAAWDRAAAVQALDESIADGTTAVQLAALRTAASRLRERDLLQALALTYPDELAEWSESYKLDDENRRLLTALLLLSGRYDQAADSAGVPGAGAIAVAAGLHANGGPQHHDLIEATLLGTTMTKANAPRETTLEERVLAGEVGAALLSSLDLLADGTGTDPESLRAGLYGLRLADQSDWARRIAVETLVLSAYPAGS